MVLIGVVIYFDLAELLELSTGKHYTYYEYNISHGLNTFEVLSEYFSNF